MSSGLMCLTCRKYLGDLDSPAPHQFCECQMPVPSMDGQTPINRRCGFCDDLSPLFTLCGRCDNAPSVRAGTAKPWPEIREAMFHDR